MSPKVAFALFLFGCALLALVNAERPPRPSKYHGVQRRPVKSGARMATIPPNQCCPCPDEDVDYDVGARRRHVRPYNRRMEVPDGCECPCEGGISAPGEDDIGAPPPVTQNPIATYEKDTRRKG